MTHYDPNIIQKHANRLYSNANAIIVLTGLAFGLFAFGAGSIGNYGAEAGAVGLLFGVLIGMSLAFNLKLKAQLALCQMRIESNTSQLLARGMPIGVVSPAAPPVVPPMQ